MTDSTHKDHESHRVGPSEALQMYLQDRENELAQSTIYSHKSRITHFVEWCKNEGIESLNQLTPPDLHRFKIDRGEQINTVTLKTQLDTLRVFLKFCESIDAITTDLPNKLLSPTLTKNEDSRDVMLSEERATELLQHLRKYEYAGLNHVILLLLWRTGMRIGGLHSLDVDDYDSDRGCIRTKHRPETGTTLKNQGEGERFISLAESTCEVLDDYLRVTRPDCNDEHGREPLICSSQDHRLAKSVIRHRIYSITRPCYSGDKCPHNRDIDSCEDNNYKDSSRCPSTVSPHAIRRGTITHFLRSDIPSKAVSDRCNVSQDVLHKHYDRRNSEEKMEQRREFFDQT